MRNSPAIAGRPRFDLGDLARAHRGQLEAGYALSSIERRVLSAIAVCRTAGLGGHIDACRSCGYEQPSYNSCRNRHCPKCQSLAQEKWIRARSKRLLPTGHFHVVFTLPSELRPLARANALAVYTALFAAASDTLLELAERRLQATLGVTMVLHTWTRDLRLHPHVHAIVTAGALARDGQSWMARPTFLFPVAMMATVFRAKMIGELRRRHSRGALQIGEDPEAFERLASQLASKRWVVYAKKPFRRSQYVLEYLGRYTHRAGFANSRILGVDGERVTFRTHGGLSTTLPAVELLRRFLLHSLPDGFQKIRHYGLYSGALVESKLARARALLEATPVEPRAKQRNAGEATDWKGLLLETTGRDVDRCPGCGGRLAHVAVARAPPGAGRGWS